MISTIVFVLIKSKYRNYKVKDNCNTNMSQHLYIGYSYYYYYYNTIIIVIIIIIPAYITIHKINAIFTYLSHYCYYK